ncbi:MAG: protein-export chaperone SecB [Gammaproteobacteria bacterium]
MAEQAAGERQIAIQRIYVKDISFESPKSPDVFGEEWKPDVNLQLNTRSAKRDDGTYEVVLTVTIDTKNDNGSVFLCEVQQAGLFAIKGFSDDEVKQVVGSFCPNQLFPYARAAIADLVSRGGFPNLALQPINFDALLAQHQQELQKAKAEADQTDERH